jgi:hypothetical protein
MGKVLKSGQRRGPCKRPSFEPPCCARLLRMKFLVDYCPVSALHPGYARQCRRQQPFFLVSSIASSSFAAVTTLFTSSPLSSMMQLTR